MRAWVWVVGMMLAAGGVVRAEVSGREYASFGVSLVGPRGWEGRFVAGEYVVARWEERKEGTAEVVAAVEVRAVPARGRTLADFAAATAGEFDGEVVGRNLQVDGERAWLVGAAGSGEGRAADVSGRGAVVVVAHAGVMYSVVGAGPAAAEWREGMRQVMERWKWIPIEAPARCMQWSDLVVAKLLGGRFAVPLPMGMGTADGGSWNADGKTATVAVRNFLSDVDEFRLTVTLEERGEGETFDGLRARLVQGAGVGWERCSEYAKRYFRPMVRTSAEGEGEGMMGTYEMYGFVEVDERHAALLAFRVVTDRAQDAASYVGRVRYMLNEISVFRGRGGN